VKLGYQKLKTNSGNSAEILGYLNYLRDIEPKTFNRIIVKYNVLFDTNVMRVLTASTITAESEAAATETFM